MPTVLSSSDKVKVQECAQLLEEIFIDNQHTVRSIFNKEPQGLLLPFTQVSKDENKARIKFVVCILDTIHDFNSSSPVMKKWVKWMLESGGNIGGTQISGDPNTKWNSSTKTTKKDEAIETMVQHPEDVALNFIFGWKDKINAKPLTDIGHEYRFEYYDSTIRHNTNLGGGYKAFYIPNISNIGWVCNELVRKQHIFGKNFGNNTDYKYENGSNKQPPMFDGNTIQGPSFMIDHGCTCILGQFVLDQANLNDANTKFKYTKTTLNCAQYTGIAKNYDISSTKSITKYCDETPIIHNFDAADATIGSLNFQITDSENSQITYIDPTSNMLSKHLLPNNAPGKKGLKNALRYLISQFNNSGSVLTFFTAATNGVTAVNAALSLTINSFKTTLLPALWNTTTATPTTQQSLSIDILWKKLSANYDLKRNGDWNQSVDCKRYDINYCEGDGWKETVFLTHDGIAAAISAVIVGVNTIWVWAPASKRVNYSYVYIPRYDENIPANTQGTQGNSANIINTLSDFVDKMDKHLSISPAITGGTNPEHLAINGVNQQGNVDPTQSTIVNKEALNNFLSYIISEMNIFNKIYDTALTQLNSTTPSLLSGILIDNYNWDIRVGNTVIDFKDDQYEKDLQNFFSNRKEMAEKLIELHKEILGKPRTGVMSTQKREEREERERNIKTIASSNVEAKIRRAAFQRAVSTVRTNIRTNELRGVNKFKVDALKMIGGTGNQLIDLLKLAFVSFYEDTEKNIKNFLIQKLKKKEGDITDKDRDDNIDEYLDTHLYPMLLYKVLNYKLEGGYDIFDFEYDVSDPKIEDKGYSYIFHILVIILDDDISSLIKSRNPNYYYRRELEDEKKSDEELSKAINVFNQQDDTFKTKISSNSNIKTTFNDLIEELKGRIGIIINTITFNNNETSDISFLILYIINDIFQLNIYEDEVFKKSIEDISTEYDKSITLLNKKESYSFSTPHMSNPIIVGSGSRTAARTLNKKHSLSKSNHILSSNTSTKLLSKKKSKNIIKIKEPNVVNKSPKQPPKQPKQPPKHPPKQPPKQQLQPPKQSPKQPLQPPKQSPKQPLQPPKQPLQPPNITKYKLRVDQYKNKNLTDYFVKKLKTHLNDPSVNVYKMGIRKMRTILKDIYKIEK